MSSRMDTMIVEQLVARVRAIMTDTKEPEETAAVAKPAYAPTGSRKREIICHKSAGSNHLSRNCLLGRSEVATDRPPESRRTMFPMQ